MKNLKEVAPGKTLGDRFVAEKEITVKTDDGRELVIAREGQEVSRKVLKRYGVETEAKGSGPSANKAGKPDEEKTESGTGTRAKNGGGAANAKSDKK